MSRDVIRSPDAPPAIGPYSQAIRAAGLLFCSGQIPLDPATGEMVGAGDVAAQTRRVMDNLAHVLAAAGRGWGDVVKVTIFCTDLGDYPTINDVYATYFDGLVPPARAAVQVAALPRGAEVEIELVATA